MDKDYQLYVPAVYLYLISTIVQLFNVVDDYHVHKKTTIKIE